MGQHSVKKHLNGGGAGSVCYSQFESELTEKPTSTIHKLANDKELPLSPHLNERAILGKPTTPRLF